MPDSFSTLEWAARWRAADYEARERMAAKLTPAAVAAVCTVLRAGECQDLRTALLVLQRRREGMGLK